MLRCDAFFSCLEEPERESQATMNDHVRDTVFGQCVRLLSGKSLLKFPDESNLNLWKYYVEEGTTATPTSSEHNDIAGSRNYKAVSVSAGREKGLKNATGSTPEHGSAKKEGLGLSRSSNDKTREVILVGWYGSEDQEV